MRKLLILLVLMSLLAMPVSALDLTAPTVPEDSVRFMPSSTESFGQGLLEVIRDALMYFSPSLKEAMGVCLGIAAMTMAVSMLQNLPGTPRKAVVMAGTVAIAATLLQSANAMINLAADTVAQISEYGKLLLPVISAALAAQGGITTSAALYTGTAVFDTVLSSLISGLLTPMIYIFLTLAAANSAIGEEMLKNLRDAVKSFMTWLLKNVLYIFTGYISITGVISGTTDAATLKAAKLTISGAVPVVGGILSDASEAVLVSAGTVKNAVGIYGLFAVIAMLIGPFLKIGVHYLLLKATAALCGIFGDKRMTDLIQDFSSAMGMLLAMTGAVSLMLMISMVCFMKGVA